MSGTAQNNLRSASVVEVTPGTIPGTPGFTTSHDPILMSAKPEVFEQSSLTAGGALTGVGIKSIAVTGEMSGALTYGTMDDWLATLLQGAWSTDVLEDAKAILTRSVENTMTAGAGGTSTMLRYRGVQAVSGKLSFSNDAEVQYQLSFVGMGSDIGTTSAIAGATYSDPANSIPLTSGIDVGAITMAGYTPGGLQSAEINFDFEGRNPQFLTTGLDTAGTTIGAFRPKISAKALIDTGFMAIYNASRAAQTVFAVTFNIGSVSGSKYTILFPDCVFGAADLDLTGAELMQDVEIIPLYDTGNSSVVTITRAVS
jgi:hypothetical protein